VQAILAVGHVDDASPVDDDVFGAGGEGSGESSITLPVELFGIGRAVGRDLYWVVGIAGVEDAQAGLE